VSELWHNFDGLSCSDFAEFCLFDLSDLISAWLLCDSLEMNLIADAISL
jgi:hypothetical protein